MKKEPDNAVLCLSQSKFRCIEFEARKSLIARSTWNSDVVPKIRCSKEPLPTAAAAGKRTTLSKTASKPTRGKAKKQKKMKRWKAAAPATVMTKTTIGRQRVIVTMKQKAMMIGAMKTMMTMMIMTVIMKSK